MKINALHLSLAAALFLAITGCEKKQASGASWPSEPVLRVDPNTAGSIAGTVTLDGAPPKFAAIDMSGEPNCKNSSPVFPQTVVAGKDGALANAVIYVKSGFGRYRFDAPHEAVALDQKGCIYQPHVLVLMVNQPLEIRNDDATIHNVHPLPKINEQWNRSQTPGAPALTTSFTRPELAIAVECNVHPWMRSYMFVFDHPYYAVTSTAGKFELRNLAPGTYTIAAWQEKYGTQDQTVTIGSKESKTVSFVFKTGVTRGN